MSLSLQPLVTRGQESGGTPAAAKPAAALWQILSQDKYVAGEQPPSAPRRPRSVSAPRKPSLPRAADAKKEIAASDAGEKQSDALRAEEIHAEMAAQRALSHEKIRAIWADVQTEFLRIWQEVLLRREKVMSELFEKWCKVLFG